MCEFGRTLGRGSASCIWGRGSADRFLGRRRRGRRPMHFGRRRDLLETLPILSQAALPSMPEPSRLTHRRTSPAARFSLPHGSPTPRRASSEVDAPMAPAAARASGPKVNTGRLGVLAVAGICICLCHTVVSYCARDHSGHVSTWHDQVRAMYGHVATRSQTCFRHQGEGRRSSTRGGLFVA